jgi:uncharacterized protein (TIGR02452 family)
MNQEYRQQIAENTLSTLAAGSYNNAQGQAVSIHAQLKKAVDASQTYGLNSLPHVALQRFPHAPPPQVTAETSLSALNRLAQQAQPHLGVLNFASARNPGGGFLRGTQAQEEALARSSGLYPCLVKHMESFYEPNRQNASLLYLDTAIGSPHVPFFKDDKGHFLPQAITATVVTAAAPNAGAMAQNQPHDLGLIPQTLERRAAAVLQLFALLEVETVVLGAWGCGVFRNDPDVVAATFAKLLLDGGTYGNTFRSVTFAIPGMQDDANQKAFLQKFKQ